MEQEILRLLIEVKKDLEIPTAGKGLASMLQVILGGVMVIIGTMIQEYWREKKEVRLIRREKLELLGHLAVEIEDAIQQIVAKINYEKKLPEGEVSPQPYEKVPELLLNVNLYHQELLQEANRIDIAIRSFMLSLQIHKNINLSDNNDPFIKSIQEVLDAKKAFMEKLISLSKIN
jgi:ethanolamine utilization cobalamin adenosyltransferase